MGKFRYGFLGCGNMGGTLAGLIANSVGGDKVAVCDFDENKTNALKEKYGVTVLDARTLSRNCQFLVLGVKPQTMKTALSNIQAEIASRKELVLISMAAGLTIEKICDYAGENFIGSVIRIMPNLPCALGVGTVLYSTMGTSNTEEETFKRDFSSAGLIDKIDENVMDGASALSGCGPAFVYYFAESLIEGALACGVEKEKATAYAVQTILGGAKMLQTGEDPATLRQKVCSPKGTTLEGIKALEDGEFKTVVSSAVQASCRRAKELQQDF